MKEDISKILYKKLSSLPDSKVLLWPDFQASFNATTGQSINDHLEDTQEVLDELEASKYIRCEQLPNKMPKLIKGVNFDAWGQVMSPTQNNNPINIGAVNASNVQVGNQNSMVVNVTPDELVEALTKLRNVHKIS